MPPNAPIDGPAGCLPHVERIAARIRRAWPGVEVVLRADRGVCRAYLMRWCEAHRIGFVFGRTKNARLRRVMGKEMHEAEEELTLATRPARVFKDFKIGAVAWVSVRRVVAEPEATCQVPN